MKQKLIMSAMALLLSAIAMSPLISDDEIYAETVDATPITVSATTTTITTETEVTAETTVTTTEPIVTTTESTTAANKSYSDDDLFCLAAAICREAGGSSEETQLLVANVIINRVNSPSYPNTIRGVLTQHMQYGMMWKYGVSFPSWATKSIKNQCYEVAQRILDGERVCPENVVFQAEFKQGSGVYKSITENGTTMYFCYK